MGKFKRVSDFVNLTGVTNSIKDKFNEKINSLVSDVYSSDLNPENLEAKIASYEKDFEKIEEASNAISATSTAIKAFRDPVGAAKDMAMQGVREIVANSQTVQNLKNEAMNKINEKLNEIPQVAQAKEEFEKIANKATEIQVPNDPSIDANYPSGEALVAAAIRDSKLARMLLKMQ